MLYVALHQFFLVRLLYSWLARLLRPSIHPFEKG